MKYYSTNRQSDPVDFREATIRGQAPDRGLYFPATIPVVEKSLTGHIGNLSNEEIAFRVIRPYTGSSIPEDHLFTIVKETIDFPIPLVTLNARISSLELFHGPTLAFKDVGARFMSRCLGYFVRDSPDKITVLVATSGDTGGAVASGFYGVEGVDVVILFPSGKVSPVQEKQLTAWGKNIYALEVLGDFDDCQQMVRQAFADTGLAGKRSLTSANSINVARWLPQQFYYFFAFRQWKDKHHPPVIAVPSGNFGNICAGMLAMRSGLPVSHFIAACNINDVVSGYLDSGRLEPRQAVPTWSNAMDVGDPGNFVRILELFGHDHEAIKNNLSAFAADDDETLDTIRSVYNETGYLADPHGAVGYLALKQYLDQHPGQKGIFLETAHPVKFPGAVESATGRPVDDPPAVREMMQREGKSIEIKPEYSALKDYLVS